MALNFHHQLIQPAGIGDSPPLGQRSFPPKPKRHFLRMHLTYFDNHLEIMAHPATASTRHTVSLSPGMNRKEAALHASATIGWQLCVSKIFALNTCLALPAPKSPTSSHTWLSQLHTTLRRATNIAGQRRRASKKRPCKSGTNSSPFKITAVLYQGQHLGSSSIHTGSCLLPLFRMPLVWRNHIPTTSNKDTVPQRFHKHLTPAM